MTIKNDMTVTIQEFFTEHNIVPNTVITLHKFNKLLNDSKQTFGEDAIRFFMDCFVPEGKTVCPGIEDSMSHYRFDCSEDWDALQRVWEEFSSGH